MIGPLKLNFDWSIQLFLTQGKDILMNPYDLVKEDSIGQGAFATVFKGKIKRTDREVCLCVGGGRGRGVCGGSCVGRGWV